MHVQAVLNSLDLMPFHFYTGPQIGPGSTSIWMFRIQDYQKPIKKILSWLPCVMITVNNLMLYILHQASKTFEGMINRAGEEGGLFNLAITMVSVDSIKN